VLAAEGLGTNDAQKALGIDERLRLTRGFLEQADERVESALADRGYTKAEADVWSEESEDATVLNVRAKLGRRHRRRALRFSGNEALTDSQLRTVFNQASPDIIRRRRLTPEALERGVEAAEFLYHSIGYGDATLSFGPPRVTRRIPLISLDRSTRWVRADIDVQEGPVTRLESISVSGIADIVSIGDLDEALDRLTGGPFSPQGLQALAQRLAAAHRAQGYLEAQAYVDKRSTGAESVAARLVVVPGERVLLRSLASRGNRRVNRPSLRPPLAPPHAAPRPRAPPPGPC